MNLRVAENVLHRYLITGKPLHSAPRFVRQAMEYIERKEQAAGSTTPREQYDLALEVRDELMAKGEGYCKRAETRKKFADYIGYDILPQHFDVKLLTAAEKLRTARQTGTWGRHANGDLVTIWDDKSGLVRLDPDEAREESKRLAERYVPALIKLSDEGRGLHYMVLTVPNIEPGELLEQKKALFRKWVNFKRIRREKHHAFAEIIGDIAIMEDPLAADGRWNVHLNVILVTQKKFHPGLYQKIRRHWKFNVEIKSLKGDAGELARTFNELIKYSARIVPEKSQAKAAHTAAPAIIEWPVARFLEWFEAQFGFRRTRTYGVLYGNKVPKPERRSLDDVIWHGAVRCEPDFFFAQLPLIDLIPGDKSTTETRIRPVTGPP